MKEISKFKLIDTILNSEEAKIILLELFTHKINFHERDVFSNNERFGTDLSNSTGRIKELKSEKQKLEGLLKYCLNEEFKVAIKCNIEIELIKKE